MLFSNYFQFILFLGQVNIIISIFTVHGLDKFGSLFLQLSEFEIESVVFIAFSICWK